MRVHHIAFRARDVVALAGFYGEIFRFREVRRIVRDGTLHGIWLGLDGAVLMLEQASAGEPEPPPGGLEFVAFAVSTADRDAFVRCCEAHGVVIEARTEHTIYVRDPEGRRVGVSSFPL